MKNVVAALLIIPFIASCEKKCHNDGYLTGKVVRISCASYVIQVLDNNNIGQDNWKDMFDNNKEYDNAINASNKCEIPDFIQKDNIVSFRISYSQAPNDCVICTLYDSPPNVYVKVEDIHILPD
jgi:hypothetical protein